MEKDMRILEDRETKEINDEKGTTGEKVKGVKGEGGGGGEKTTFKEMKHRGTGARNIN